MASNANNQFRHSYNSNDYDTSPPSCKKIGLFACLTFGFTAFIWLGFTALAFLGANLNKDVPFNDDDFASFDVHNNTRS